jgi:hypothetical protein
MADGFFGGRHLYGLLDFYVIAMHKADEPLRFVILSHLILEKPAVG